MGQRMVQELKNWRVEVFLGYNVLFTLQFRVEFYQYSTDGVVLVLFLSLVFFDSTRPSISK